MLNAVNALLPLIRHETTMSCVASTVPDPSQLRTSGVICDGIKIAMLRCPLSYLMTSFPLNAALAVSVISPSAFTLTVHPADGIP